MVGCPPEPIALETASGAWANYTEPVDAVLAYILHAGFFCNLDSQLLRDRQELETSVRCGNETVTSRTARSSRLPKRHNPSGNVDSGGTVPRWFY